MPTGIAPREEVDGDGQTPVDVARSFGFSRMLDVLRMAETEAGMEELKMEMLPDYQEAFERRAATEKAKQDAVDMKVMPPRA